MRRNFVYLNTVSLFLLFSLFSISTNAKIINNKEKIFNCDRYAVSPRDPSRLTKGVILKEINYDTALKNCQISNHESDAKIHINLYRIYLSNKNYERSDHHLKIAIKLKHPYSYFIAGEAPLTESVDKTTWFRLNKHVVSMLYLDKALSSGVDIAACPFKDLTNFLLKRGVKVFTLSRRTVERRHNNAVVIVKNKNIVCKNNRNYIILNRLKEELENIENNVK